MSMFCIFYHFNHLFHIVLHSAPNRNGESKCEARAVMCRWMVRQCIYMWGGNSLEDLKSTINFLK